MVVLGLGESELQERPSRRIGIYKTEAGGLRLGGYLARSFHTGVMIARTSRLTALGKVGF
jgi:hypothetical protein